MTRFPPVGWSQSHWDGDPLSVSGTVALARVNCREACFAYHASWRITRRAGLKGNPSWHSDFYRTELQSAFPPPAERTSPNVNAGGTLDTTAIRTGGGVAGGVGRPGPTRVLVCGAADETMLAVLADALGAERIAVHLIDACATPLILSQTYAARHGIVLSTDVDTAPEISSVHGPFEAIVTDGLLSLLPDTEAREATLRRLAALLAPDGVLLYTTRVAGPSGALEYDLHGRAIQAVMTWLAWPRRTHSDDDPAGSAGGSVGNSASKVAGRVWRQPARTAPFTTAAEVEDAFREWFARVHTVSPTGSPSVAVRMHPAARAGRGSTSVGVVAAGPDRDRPRPVRDGGHT